MDTAVSPLRPNILKYDFSQGDDILSQRDGAAIPQRWPKVPTQPARTQHRIDEEDDWLLESPAQGPDPKRQDHNGKHDFNFEVNEPAMEGNIYMTATAPRSLSPPVTQPYQSMKFDENAHLSANGSRSRSPMPAQKFQAMTFEEEPRIPAATVQQKNLNYYGNVTKDNESVAESMDTTTSSTRFANFFGQEVFQIVLHNPTTSHQLNKFSQSRLCGENMDFLERVDRFNALTDELGATMLDIYKKFISVNAPSQLNLSNTVMTKMNKDLKVSLGNALPKMESLFTSAQHHTEDLVFSDIYPRFVRHQLVVSATKALAADRSKYAGLGDCFVLTDPAKADNPIVFASDGFVNVTGYTRSDIIPRNCRFLQGRHTDREAVKRLKLSVDNREESVELLLNYKKNKEPFWNLLYTAPLFDENGNTAFFIGGQINCSTTIHSASDILRILSYSEDVEDKQDKSAEPAPVKKSTFGRSFLKVLRGDSLAEINGTKAAGMENALLNKIDKLTIKKQMESFHSAYSKYLVIKYDSMAITFFSMNVIDMLYTNKPMFGQVVGNNVFSFLEQHAVNIGRDYKSRVKASLKAGQPISLDLNLSIWKYLKYVKFATHWTPLKDGEGKVCYVVLTLGSSQL